MIAIEQLRQTRGRNILRDRAVVALHIRWVERDQVTVFVFRQYFDGPHQTGERARAHTAVRMSTLGEVK